MAILPDYAAFAKKYESGEPQAVYARLVADLETPVSAFLKLAEGRDNAFLFESVQGGETRGRYSIVGMKPDLVWRYQGGRANYLDVLTAQRDLFNSELSLAQTRRNQLVSVVQLYKALGGGWSPGPAGPGKATEGMRGESAKPVESQRVRTVDR